MRGDPRQRNNDSRQRVNEQITAASVRLIGSEGEQLGIIATPQAIAAAEAQGLDLVEVASNSEPPVCKLMDFGKFQYQQKKKLKEAKKNQTVISVKEIKFRPRTEQNDFDHKVKRMRKFLEDGDKVKLKVFFRGREMMHPKIGEAVILRAVEAAEDLGKIESPPKMEGRQMIAVMAPLRTEK